MKYFQTHVTESGYIEFEEFRTVFQPPSHDELLKTFKKFDKNDDGFLSPDEVKEILKSANQPATDRNVREMIKVLDANGDGKINYKGKFDSKCNTNLIHIEIYIHM